MAGTLLIIGITLFLVGTLMLVQDANGRGRNALVVMLPFVGIPYARHYWSEVWPGVVLRVVGGTLVVFGLVIWVAQHPQWLRFDFRRDTAPVLTGSVAPGVSPMIDAGLVVRLGLTGRQGSDLSGRLFGESFSYDRARLIGGVLSIQQGESFIPQREVRVLIGLDANTLTKREDIFVRPSDTNAPEIHVSFTPEGKNLPETRIYHHGYSMELQLAPLDQNQLKGYMQLILPGAEPDYLVGDFIVLSNNLIYRNGRVDLTHDDPDTLEYVGSQYVAAQYPASLIQRVEYRDTRMRLSRNSGSTVARIFLKNGRIEDKFLEFERADIGWALRPGGVNTEVITEGGAARAPEQGSAAEQLKAAPVTRLVTFPELVELVGQRITLKLKNGDQYVGDVLDIRRDLMRMQRQVGSGVVEFRVSEKEIALITLQSGERLTLVAGPEGTTPASSEPAAGAVDASAVPEATPAQAPAAPESVQTAPPPAAEKEGDYSALVGKNVTLTTRDGKSRTGVLIAVSANEIKLGVRLGSGVLEYFYVPADVASIKEASR